MTTATLHRYTRRLLLHLFAVLLCCLAPAAAFAAMTWTTETVDNNVGGITDTGKSASLALDSLNKLHISYLDVTNASLMYATNKTGPWVSSTAGAKPVDNDWTAIAVDPLTDRPQISYYFALGGPGDKGIMNTVFDGVSAWTGTKIDSAKYTPGGNIYTSIANRNGVSHAIYIRSAGDGFLRYASSSGPDYNTWGSNAALDTANNAGTNNAVTVDSTGKVHVVGYNSTVTQLYYYTNRSGSWAAGTLVTAASGVGPYCAIASSGSGPGETLVIAYLDKTNNKILVATKPVDGGSWVSALPAGTDIPAGSSGANKGGHISLAVDSAGAIHVSFYYNAGTTGYLRYATNAGGSWYVEDVDGTASPVLNAGQFSSIVVDGNQTVNIAYYDVTNTALKVAIKHAFHVAPAPATFGSVDRGYQSLSQTVTITNNLRVSQTIETVTIGGANPGDFVLTGGNCAGSLWAPEQSCQVQLYFAPPAEAPRSSARNATLDVTTTGPFVLVNSSVLSGSTSDNYLLTASAGSGGSISPVKVAVAPGGSQTFTVTPAYGYGIDSVTDNGSPMGAAPYTIAGIADDHTVAASFIVTAPFRILQTMAPYVTLQAAYDAATLTENIIEGKAGVFATEFLTASQNITATLKGGYDSVFSSQTGSTTLHSILVHVPNDNAGRLIVEKVVLK